VEIAGLLIRSRAAIARFERANADGNPVELAEARTVLAACHSEVRRFVAAKKAMKSEKLESTIQKLAASSVTERRSGNGLRLANWADNRPRSAPLT
jgi:hypothetical protein